MPVPTLNSPTAPRVGGGDQRARRRRRRRRSRGSARRRRRPSARPPADQRAAEDRDDAGLADRALARAVDVAEAQVRRRACRAARGRAARSPRRPASPARRASPAAAARPRRAARSPSRARRRRRSSRRGRSCRRPASRAASSRLTVPSTLTRASRPGSPTETRTSTCAARWKTRSGRKSAQTRAYGGGVGDVGGDERRAALQRLGDVSPAAGREVVDHGHLDRRASTQRVDEMGADEPGAAADEGPHPGERRATASRRVAAAGARKGGCYSRRRSRRLNRATDPPGPREGRCA